MDLPVFLSRCPPLAGRTVIAGMACIENVRMLCADFYKIRAAKLSQGELTSPLRGNFKRNMLGMECEWVNI